MHLSSLIIGALLAWSPSVFAANKKKDAVLLSQVRSLTLRDGKKTSHRRVKAVPQLTCVGGNAKGLYSVDVMRCQNSGSEYDPEDIQWTCKADLPAEFKLGSTDVVCEGYDSSNDPYILKGSCGVEYRLVLTPQGEAKYRNHINSNAWKSKSGSSGTGSDALAGYLFWIVFAVIVLVILYSVFFPGTNNTTQRAPRRRQGGYRGGGGGGGFDDNDDPPPPYTPRSNSKPYSSFASNSRQQQQQGWQPGFWSGTAAGAAAGYAAGAFRNNATRAGPSRSSLWNSGGGSSSSSNTYGGSSGSSSPPAPSSSRHESTGFGGTSRR